MRVWRHSAQNEGVDDIPKAKLAIPRIPPNLAIARTEVEYRITQGEDANEPPVGPVDD